MHESPDDLAGLQQLLERSYASAGPHLLGIHTPERRLAATQLVDRLTGMCLLTLATVTADGRPLAGPVDGVFYRGAFHFSSSPDSVRCRHLRRRPDVSAVHLPGEEFAVTVHGRAVPVAFGGGLRATYHEVYLPTMGPDAVEFFDGDVFFARIEPVRMYAFTL